ncbi:MAG TPA: ATP-binding domain-containing protein, partial [Burkholderiales bacterium]|nr:ATP-binding domain-containing protein [Burkholderiales bacterium]
SACESAFAMTVHKAQGSEFEEVALVLPRTISPVLSRELFYTAITRASRKVHVYGGEEIARAALARQTERDSALAERLR